MWTCDLHTYTDKHGSTYTYGYMHTSHTHMQFHQKNTQIHTNFTVHKPLLDLIKPYFFKYEQPLVIRNRLNFP